MPHLAVANILHHKLRSALSALGIGIGICMFVTLSGLARGSLYEISDRWESVDAELLAYPMIWEDNVITISGVGLPDKEAARIAGDHADIVERAVPVFIWRHKFGGQPQAIFGADSNSAGRQTLTNGRALLKGRWCDPDSLAAGWLERTLLGKPKAGEEDAVLTTEFLRDGLKERGGFELVIDDRLARAEGLDAGDTVRMAEHDWTIVGILPEGVVARMFMPRRTAQWLFNSANIKMSTVMFIKLRAGVKPLEAAGRLRTPMREVVLVRQYRQMLEQTFGIMFRYVDVVNVIALVIAFLFIMITLYTIVLQRTRDIAILRSCGAGSGFIIRQVLAESGLLTAAGVIAGVGLSFPAAWVIQTARPLLTVTITWPWIATAAAAAVVGAFLSAVYPAWRAIRVDVAEALTLE